VVDEMIDPSATDLTDLDYGTCILAIAKCQLIWRAVKAGLPVTITKDNFGFCELSDEEESQLITKLANNKDIEWLKQQRNKQ
jgi:hypothetical protein